MLKRLPTSKKKRVWKARKCCSRQGEWKFCPYCGAPWVVGKTCQRCDEKTVGGGKLCRYHVALAKRNRLLQSIRRADEELKSIEYDIEVRQKGGNQ